MKTAPAGNCRPHSLTSLKYNGQYCKEIQLLPISRLSLFFYLDPGEQRNIQVYHKTLSTWSSLATCTLRPYMTEAASDLS